MFDEKIEDTSCWIYLMNKLFELPRNSKFTNIIKTRTKVKKKIMEAKIKYDIQ